jgi:TIR domain
MISDTDQRPLADLLRVYQGVVQSSYPANVETWPLLNGWNILKGMFKDWMVIVVKDAGFAAMCMQTGIGELSATAVGVSDITDENRDTTRRRLEKPFNIEPRDAVILFAPNGDIAPEIEAMFLRHEIALGLANMKIFLSHKGVDKEMVRRFERLLSELGFDPWLDDDAMPAGAQPDRAIQKGFKDSCAAVFFVTPNFKDETWLATEIEYARTEKREKGEGFAIITLCLSKDGQEGDVPGLLRHFIYKKPKHEMEAMLEIIRALPIKAGAPRFP